MSSEPERRGEAVVLDKIPAEKTPAWLSATLPSFFPLTHFAPPMPLGKEEEEKSMTYELLHHKGMEAVHYGEKYLSTPSNIASFLALRSSPSHLPLLVPPPLVSNGN